MVAQTHKNYKMKNLEERKFDNIYYSSLVVVSSETIDMKCAVRQINTAFLKVPEFSALQFIKGAEMCDNPVDKESFQLVIKLALIRENSNPVEFTFFELIMLRNWLEGRMLHCEMERDQRAVKSIGGVDYPRFNADTYIGMKLLLISIRELLLGEIIR